MKREITLGNFIFCLLNEMPVMGNDCQGCEFIIQEEGIYFCTHSEEDDED
ncbi:hypothetical protein ASZ90_018104 [hydrocarbon metagenome]|uniref:Uncharacterized protein n=1 Tax=hydrocarbon metagenome TaxID=938273 RepID=A0A0W8E801_9ZZZZ